MVEQICTGIEGELRHCPICRRVTTFALVESLGKDEQGDIKNDIYYRCLLCLTLFRLVLQEVKE